jgi:hypothetical protein
MSLTAPTVFLGWVPSGWDDLGPVRLDCPASALDEESGTLDVHLVTTSRQDPRIPPLEGRAEIVTEESP